MAEDDIAKIKGEIEEMRNLIKEHGWGSMLLYVTKKQEKVPLFAIAYQELVREGYFNT